ncbi:MAG: hypothetical protein AWU57_482 [Marinobacter sp. T13-3]|nr:MAG: hypothetical protein AWU57_482 [Marinobacter sp. T13-3]
MTRTPTALTIALNILKSTAFPLGLTFFPFVAGVALGLPPAQAWSLYATTPDLLVPSLVMGAGALALTGYTWLSDALYRKREADAEAERNHLYESINRVGNR